MADVAARVHGGDAYPAVTGIVVRAGRRRAFLDATTIDRAGSRAVRLRAARIDWGVSGCRAGKVLLARDILDSQLVHTGEARVIRVADLYFAAAGAELRLAGVACDLRTLLLGLAPRRLRGGRSGTRSSTGPSSRGSAPARARCLRQGSGPRMRGLRRLRPAELACVLEGLGTRERQELLASLGYGITAHAPEELQGQRPDRAAACGRPGARGPTAGGDGAWRGAACAAPPPPMRPAWPAEPDARDGAA